jgi:hypothetical protein
MRLSKYTHYIHSIHFNDHWRHNFNSPNHTQKMSAVLILALLFVLQFFGALAAAAVRGGWK